MLEDFLGIREKLNSTQICADLGACSAESDRMTNFNQYGNDSLCEVFCLLI